MSLCLFLTCVVSFANRKVRTDELAKVVTGFIVRRFGGALATLWLTALLERIAYDLLFGRLRVNLGRDKMLYAIKLRDGFLIGLVMKF